ncbi:DNA polymerase subunit Cdc27 [Gautieria morchelliformis]|nr:DNA polymerase subunit Cdc27 [Gautieria morchelliformis]
MTSAIATEFLTKQLSIEKETVTFRWLSRKLSVHVNVAKNELASFYASSRSTDVPVHATYLLTGEVAPVNAAGSYRDNVQDDMGIEDTHASVATRKIILVGEDDLEAAKAQFTRAPSVHIYSLSPSAIRDAALLAPMADRVRPDDISKGKAYNQIIGIVVGPDVKIGQTNKGGTSKLAKTHPSASSSRPSPPAAAKGIAEKPLSSEKGKASQKPKQEEKKKGALDWSKAEAKEEKEKEPMPAKTTKVVVKKESKSAVKQKVEKLQPAPKKDEDLKAKVKKEPKEAAMTSTKKTVESDKPKRGTKRPSAVMSLSDSEDDNPSPKTKIRTSASPLHSRPPSRVNGIKVKKGVLLSDDDEDSPQEMKPKKAVKQMGKGRAQVAEDEEVEMDPSIRAMMDLDDSEVTRHNNRVSASGCQSDEDVGMLSDEEPIPARPRAKRKPKKVIPVGKNGLPKRRVVKSRKSKNAKGYTITEDYSSYESVSETEQAQPPSDTEKRPKKSKKKAQKVEDTTMTGTSTGNGCNKSKDMVDDYSGKTEKKSQNGEGKSETMKPGSGPGGGGLTSKAGTKASNGGKNNLMSYFTKK